MSNALFLRQITNFVDRNMSPAALSASLAKTAQDVLAALISSGAAPPQYTRYVDGKQGAPESSVSPDGVIYYAFNLLPDIVAFAIAFLRQRSPGGLNPDTEPFRDSFFIAVNGRLIRPNDFRSDKVPVGAQIVIGNTRPYNRLVDVQIAGRRRVRYAVPPNLYLDAGKAIERRWGGVVRAYRHYNIVFPGKYVLKTGDRRGKPVQSPGLIIEPRGSVT